MIAIREATRADAPGIAQVWQAAFAEKVKAQTILSKIGPENRTSALTVVAVSGAGEVVGFCIMTRKTPTGRAYVGYIATHPIRRVPGAGGKLLEAGIALAVQHWGARDVFTCVRRNNPRSLSLHERHGFVVCEDRPAGFTLRKEIDHD